MWGEALVRIAVATLVGLVFGYLSWARNIRVFIIITVGATLVTITSVEFFKLSGLPWVADPGRIAAQIIVALGFLGTGLIWISEDSKVKGLPVAGSLLVTAIIGMLIGLGDVRTLLVVIFLLLLFYFLSYFEFNVRRKHRREQ
ncbi:MAG TPA: MgtC/SapB family protein [Syntrophomonadaceae bacterium]|nr:MgtC/SapB family protein [Syntrophomonadaceae bacterium]HNX28518.1 MgtC/SapB family protein [Syntrophomonadaceae bacterium]HPR93048.1 MgtC/SapB family protein [Syntrophomonadaceae bacterium]